MRHCASLLINPEVLMARLSRVLVLVLPLAVLAGCGFKLRQDVAWRADWQPLSITAPDPVSALKQQLELRLRQQDVQLVESSPTAGLAIRRESLSRDVLSVDEGAPVRD